MIAALFAAALFAQDVPEIPAILRREPAELPRASEGRWAGWPHDVDIDERAIALVRGFESDTTLDFVGTLEVLYEMLEIEPDHPDALVLLGLAYFKLQRYGDAVVPYERFLEVVPGEVEHTHALGHAYYSLGEYERARDHYRRILAVVPRSHEALRGLALSELRLGDEEAALDRLHAALGVLPDDFESHLWVARILEGRGEAELAREHVRRGLELRPFDPRVWYLEMQTLYALGRDEEAAGAEERWRELDGVAQELRKLEAILRIHPRNFELVGRTVELRRSIGDVPGTRAALDRMERVRPADFPLVELRIYALDVLWSLQDLEGADRAARVLARDCPDDVAAWRRLELHYGATKARLEQIEAGRRARELARGQ